MNTFKIYSFIGLMAITWMACSKKDDNNSTPVAVTPAAPRLIFKFKFDSTQVRLNNFGQPASIPAGHSGQSPRFNKMSAHYIELAQDSLTALGFGKILYRAKETTLGGSNAIDFDSSVVVGEGTTFFSVPLSSVSTGTYKWLRVSLAYQNYTIRYHAVGTDFTGTIASFIGFKTYIRSYYIADSTVAVNANKSQGYWGFESVGPIIQGQAPATTVPNPINSSSPVPAGSCVVTGAFASPFVITGSETSDVVVTVSLSTNKSFEWTDVNSNGVYEPLDGDAVVDMGIRGLIPIVQ